MYKQKSETTNITKIIVNHRISDELLLLSSRVYNCMQCRREELASGGCLVESTWKSQNFEFYLKIYFFGKIIFGDLQRKRKRLRNMSREVSVNRSQIFLYCMEPLMELLICSPGISAIV
jgi:hypothetical protein